ncbi:hypothetical protein EYF80_011735 [Liparis tanakae]|uniref:Uncharacterized protein n=1 Tax=Liparis tanakae TaxID=230148 RepID=A0A4Z2ILB0_9TELE|nr:hypothetical protein EYF80_011735 [Liparis tanakae]
MVSPDSGRAASGGGGLRQSDAPHALQDKTSVVTETARRDETASGCARSDVLAIIKLNSVNNSMSDASIGRLIQVTALDAVYVRVSVDGLLPPADRKLTRLREDCIVIDENNNLKKSH